ncbi:hypothetical protein B0G81_5005 [Paraburkholderia sp. BL6665CI2N2]|uniref:hypothetical protein n=1 Tax=Paraburkholderia sp. BL6665CI2N2 TaxID=1938806 RepID=UPI0010DA591D|nr:hypothetical protein [Paraburkholderia sp. BL6665CI2N2]TDY24567.1 hypothetical protein B0G81_5005 [Paraburkholderia sp. BL6665CI2N2]
MEAIWDFALNNPALLVVPAVGFVLSLVVLRIKTRYVNEGVLFRRKPATQRDHDASKSAEKEMNSDNHIDLEIALRKLHELGLEDGDLGYAYWYQVGELLRQAGGMQAQIDALGKELEQLRAARQKLD